MLVVAIICICFALIGYTLAIWYNRQSLLISKRRYKIFKLAIIADASGTGIMSYLAYGHTMTIHGYIGFLSLLIMGLHFLWARKIHTQAPSNGIYVFHRWSRWAWFIWLIAFILGMPKI